MEVEIPVLDGVGLLLKWKLFIYVCWLFLIAECSIQVVLCWLLHVATRTTRLSFQMSCRNCDKHIGVSTGILFLLTTGLVSYIFHIICSVLLEGALFHWVFFSIWKDTEPYSACVTSFPYFPDPLNEANVSLSARMLTVCSNHSSVTRLLGHVAQRATEMLSARAYLHWYKCYGIEMEEFQQALNTLSGVIEEYVSQWCLDHSPNNESINVKCMDGV